VLKVAVTAIVAGVVAGVGGWFIGSGAAKTVTITKTMPATTVTITASPPTSPPAGKPIKIGLLADLTGGLATYGYTHKKTLKAAVNKVNAEGGIAGRPVEIVVEDTETKVDVGITKMRKLIEYYDVDFIWGSNHSGIAIACNSMAKEYKVLHWPVVGALEVTAEKGNRYVFRLCSNVRQEMKAIAEWCIERVAKKWVTLVVDYAWGWSCEKEFKNYCAEKGGTVIKSIRCPLGTKDFMPYLAGIPKEAEAALIAFFGTDLISLLKDLYAIRPDIKKAIAHYGFTGIDTEKLGDPAEGTYIVSSFPRRLKGFDTPYTRAFRKAIGVDEEGRDIEKPTIFSALQYTWAVWETLFILKKAIEESGWKSVNDNPELIKTIEGMSVKEGFEFPQGSKTIRAQDHQAFPSLFIEQVVKGKLDVVARIPAEKLSYPPPADYSKEAF